MSKSDKTLRVNGEKVEGWMGAMTMNYKVDNASIFDRMKPGDDIAAGLRWRLFASPSQDHGPDCGKRKVQEIGEFEITPVLVGVGASGARFFPNIFRRDSQSTPILASVA